MNLTTVTAPPFEPVTLADVYMHLRLDTEGSPPTHPHDDMLTRHIATARGHVEQMARRSLVLQTLRLSCAGFPWNCATASRVWSRPTPAAVRLLRPPLIGVDSVSYYDGDNALQTVSPAAYYTTDEQVPELRFAGTFSAPSVYDRPDALRVTYRTGYAPDGSPPESQADYAASVPKPLHDAILLGVQLLYDQLDPSDRAAIEGAREALVQPYRVQLAL